MSNILNDPKDTSNNTTEPIQSHLRVGDRVEKLSGMGQGSVGTVQEVVGNKVRVRTWSPKLQNFRLQRATNYRLMNEDVDKADEADEVEEVQNIEGAPGEDALEDAFKDTLEYVSSSSGSVSPVSEVSEPEESFTIADTSSAANTSSQSSCPLPFLRMRQHSIVVASWNSHQFTFVEDETKQDLLRELAGLVVVEWQVDVLLLSEIPCQRGPSRVRVFCEMLNEVLTGKDNSNGECVTFKAHFSKRSGVHTAEGKENRPEYHVAIVKDTLTVEFEYTHHFYAGQDSQMHRLDHAPYTICVRDDRFAHKACRRLALTSVHFPPSGRRTSRDTQGKNFFQNYLNQWSWPNAMKKDRPSTFTKMDKAFCTHVIGGDFNCEPFQTFGLEDCMQGTRGKNSSGSSGTTGWWVAFDSEVATSYGAKAYDNWVVNRSAVDKVWLDVSKNVGALPLSQHTKDGLSDHDAILLKFTERLDRNKPQQ